MFWNTCLKLCNKNYLKSFNLVFCIIFINKRKIVLNLLKISFSGYENSCKQAGDPQFKSHVPILLIFVKHKCS